MRLGSLDIVLHRTARVADGRQPANLPPSVGRMQICKVSDYPSCPGNWEKNGVFVALHETEAMWLSFNRGVQVDWMHPINSGPVALLIGAGGINALTGEKLGTTLAKDNYVVCPPQPWLDGWKDKDGTVYQFVATAYEEGKGNTVAEQLIGAESKTGALGIALYEAKDPSSISLKLPTGVGSVDSAYGSDISYDSCSESPIKFMSLSAGNKGPSRGFTRGRALFGRDRIGHTTPDASSFSEMGVGKGGKIIQKIYPDPYGLDVWKDKPTDTMAIYLVNAQDFKRITGIEIPQPATQAGYQSKYFGMNDGKEADVPGSDKFTSLKSATEKKPLLGITSGVFPADTTNKG